MLERVATEDADELDVQGLKSELVIAPEKFQVPPDTIKGDWA
ncbi:MAG TPA: hypothetical protein VGO47_13800 [Chlamydiales bacterium]|nr:hypothetical protein [Chlamydiales bacterium]